MEQLSFQGFMASVAVDQFLYPFDSGRIAVSDPQQEPGFLPEPPR